MNAIPMCEHAPPHSTDTLVFASPSSSSAHAELLSICERLATIWSERARSEDALWKSLKLELAETSTLEEALQAYSENAARRSRMVLQDAQRLFEEHQKIVARFSRPHA